MFKAKKLGSNKAGFTLIEVVLVLAIGGLIFLLAFIAFGQATKNRRDTQRRSDGARIISEIENAKGDAGGSSFSSGPTLATFLTQYLAATSTTATGGSFTSNNINYTVTYGTAIPTGTTVSSGTGIIYASENRKCSTSSAGATVAGSGSGDYAVLIQLEKGIACRDNQ